MGKPSSASQASGIGVLDKAVVILDATATQPRSLAELVDASGLPRATAHRLAVALEVHHLLARDADGRFVPGPRLVELGAAVPDPLVAAAGPVLAYVRDETGESAQLYRSDGSERICIASADRASGLRTTVAVGARLPLTAGSAAQVLCAWRTDHGVVELLARAEFTGRGLAEVRKRGWAQSVGQREAGVASVSAPVRAPDGSVIAALSMSGPIERLGRAPGLRYGAILTRAARTLSAAVTPPA